MKVSVKMNASLEALLAGGLPIPRSGYRPDINQALKQPPLSKQKAKVVLHHQPCLAEAVVE